MDLDRVLFPFEKPRQSQAEFMDGVWSALEGKKHLVCHAPTGLGKTVSVLCPAITYALENDKTVFFLSPKTSQHELAVDVVKSISKKFGVSVSAVDFVGKRHMCSDPLLSGADSEGFYEVCSKRVKREQCSYYGNAVGYSEAQKDVSRLYIEKLSKSSLPVLNHFEFKEKCVSMAGPEGERPMCAYEASVIAGRERNVIVCDYFHLLSPRVHKFTLNRLSKKLSESIVIVDEAHNVPERVRKILGSSLSTFVLDQACEELSKLGETGLVEKCRHVKKTISTIAKNSLKNGASEALVQKDDFSIQVSEKISDMENFSSTLRLRAVDYLEASSRSKSRLVRVANFLDNWQRDEKNFVRICRAFPNGSGYGLSLLCLDSSDFLGSVFNKTHSTIAMSGTLLPTIMYRDLLGMGPARTVLKEYANPFPKENRLTLVVPSVTTRFAERNEEEYKKIARTVAGIVNLTPGNSAVFFPSFSMLDQVNFFLQPLVKREIFRQRKEMSPGERVVQLKRFRDAGKKFGGVLLGAASGSYAEGIDFPGNELLCAVIVGVPLQELDLYTKCLIDFFEEKFARGWHYAYLFPAVSRAVQAGGRVIRGESDKGVVVFLDKRYDWGNFSKCFPKDLNAVKTMQPEKFVQEFWAKN
ncbi:MAG: ATP-dependent DNA helicase [archaeon]|nr:ATP-dependent DNA helicase [archaeon]